MLCRSRYCLFEWGHLAFILEDLAAEGELPRFLTLAPQTRERLSRALVPDPYYATNAQFSAQLRPYKMTHIVNRHDGSLIEIVESPHLALDTGVLLGDSVTFLVFQEVNL